MIEGGASRTTEAIPAILTGTSAAGLLRSSMDEVAELLSPLPAVFQMPPQDWTFVTPPGYTGILPRLIPLLSWPSYEGQIYWRESFLGCIGMASISGMDLEIEITSNKVLTFHSPSRGRTEEDAVAQATVRSFGAINDVAAVYVDAGPSGMTVWVFVDREQYDDALMDRLLDEEMKVLSCFPDQVVSFKYLPAPGRSQLRDVVGKDARLVFRR